MSDPRTTAQIVTDSLDTISSQLSDLSRLLLPLLPAVLPQGEFLLDGGHLGGNLLLGGDIGQNAQLTAGIRKEVSFASGRIETMMTVDVSNFRAVSIHITGIGGTATLIWELSNDGINWVSFACQRVDLFSAAPATSTTIGSRLYFGQLNARYFRLRNSAIASGTTKGVVEFFDHAPSPAYVASQFVATTSNAYSFQNINSATTTTVKSGAGTLHTITVNNKGTTSTATVYDNTAGSGTVIGVIDTTVSGACLSFDLAFATGLTLVTVGTADLTVNYV